MRRMLMLALCAAACGCSAPSATFLEQRGIDLADCFDVSVGVGELIPYARIKITDYAVIGAGKGGTIFSLGWHGRYTAAGTLHEAGNGIPLVRNQEWRGAPPMIETRGPCLTTRRYDPDAPPAEGTRRADRWWIGAWAAWVLSVRANFNIVEYADFMAGWFGADLLRDDDAELRDWSERLREREKPHPVL